jgi:hypothetical protein
MEWVPGALTFVPETAPLIKNRKQMDAARAVRGHQMLGRSGIFRNASYMTKVMQEDALRKPWFAIRPDADHGRFSHLLGFGAAPKSWQGWLLTAVYYAVMAAIVIFHLPSLQTEALALGVMLVALLVWHLGVLWLASRHFEEIPAEGV